MAVPHDDLVDDALGPVLRSELALLDGAFDKDVLALLEGERDFGEVSVERQAVPVGALLPLLAAVLKAIRLAQSHIGDGYPEGKYLTSGFFARWPATSTRFICMRN